MNFMKKCRWICSLSVALLFLGLASCTGIDPTKLLPSGKQKNRCYTLPGGGCRTLPTADLEICTHGGGDWSLTVPTGASHQDINFASTDLRQAAAAVDWADGKSDVAGFVISQRSDHASAADHARGVIASLIAAQEFVDIRLRQPGQLTTTHDGHQAVIGTEVQIQIASQAQVNWVRNRLYPFLLGGDLARFDPLPTPDQESSTAFVLVYATVLRKGQGRALVSGGVATLNSYYSRVSRSRRRAALLSDGTAIAKYAAEAEASCDEHQIRDMGRADLLWVNSERDAVAKTREKLLKSAAAIWQAGKRSGLDFRMAVAGMGASSLCAATGETPRFFSSATENDLVLFQRCMLTPGGGSLITADESGLERGRKMVLSLLPPEKGAPERWRADSAKAVIFTADRPPESVRKLFLGTVPPAPLSVTDRVKLDGLLQPTVALMNGVDHAGNTYPSGARASQFRAVAHGLLSDATRASCGAERATGYVELIAKLGGRSFAMSNATSIAGCR